MHSLASLDCTIKITHQRSSTSVNGMEVSSSETTEAVIQLPRAAAIRATFSKEGVGRKILKLFTRELQTGDGGFDDAVYISTETSDETAAWLGSQRIRDFIADCVTTAGPITIDGSVVTVHLQGTVHDEPPELVEFVGSLLG